MGEREIRFTGEFGRKQNKICRSQKEKIYIFTHFMDSTEHEHSLSTGLFILDPNATDKNKTYIFKKKMTYPLSKMPSNTRRKGFTRIVF